MNFLNNIFVFQDTHFTQPCGLDTNIEAACIISIFGSAKF